MKLLIAEKPSVARDIAQVVGARTKRQGMLVGSGFTVTWCIGHLIELEEPDAYNKAWKRWSFETLPMLPAEFLLRPVKGTMSQWRIVQNLLKRQQEFESVVNACDAGREGELIFRYAYQLASSAIPIERLWISSLTPAAIQAGLQALKPGSDYDALAAAARCRSEADWLVGLNATRAMTLSQRGADEEGVFSIGRVQTPTLALLVRREQAIQKFEPKDFWEVVADVTGGEDQPFTAKWRTEDGSSRMKRAELAETLTERIQQVVAPQEDRLVVETINKKTQVERPPHLFDLTTLQRMANQRFGFSADRTLRAAQDLYEKYKLITYPRTASRFLGEPQRPELPGLVSAFNPHPEYGVHAQRLDPKKLKITKRLIDDSKIGDHHAIIPTGKQTDLDRLPPDERKIFDLIVRRFLAAFYPDAKVAVTEVILRAGSEEGPFNFKATAEGRDRILERLPEPPDRFFARGRMLLEAGWQEVEKPPQKSSEKKQQPLPPLKVGERWPAAFRQTTGRTQPPKRLTDASLLAAMEGAGKEIDDDELREAMKDSGLGTPATRAAIIETLIRRAFVRREKKSLVPTSKGIYLIDNLPVPTLSSPELTGEWEARLAQIARGRDARANFMQDVTTLVQGIVPALQKVRRARPQVQLAPCPRCGSEILETRSVYECQRCPVSIRKYLAKRPISRLEASMLLTRRRTDLLHGFKSKKGRSFASFLVLSEDGEVSFELPQRKGASKKESPKKKRSPKKKVEVDKLVCPRCQKDGLVAGKGAWGCAHWRDGCKFVVPFVMAGKKVTPKELEDLVTKGRTRRTKFPDGRGRMVLPAEGAVQFELD